MNKKIKSSRPALRSTHDIQNYLNMSLIIPYSGDNNRIFNKHKTMYSGPLWFEEIKYFTKQIWRFRIHSDIVIYMCMNEV